MNNLDQLKQEIKEVIINTLQLEDIAPENIVNSEPLFGEGLGLDSIDALELSVGLKRKFGVKFSSESADNKKHFASIDALAEYINQARGND
ncbi:MAG: phosphopantetheine-binding protein [Treponema sp.]|nr:phosphopantetheine-binding protein [Treponema sp.]